MLWFPWDFSFGWTFYIIARVIPYFLTIWSRMIRLELEARNFRIGNWIHFKAESLVFPISMYNILLRFTHFPHQYCTMSPSGKGDDDMKRNSTFYLFWSTKMASMLDGSCLSLEHTGFLRDGLHGTPLDLPGDLEPRLPFGKGQETCRAGSRTARNDIYLSMPKICSSFRFGRSFGDSNGLPSFPEFRILSYDTQRNTFYLWTNYLHKHDERQLQYIASVPLYALLLFVWI